MFGSDQSKDMLKAVPIPDRLKKGEKALIITSDNTEDLEFFYPYYRLHESGYQVDVVTPKGKAFKTKHGYEFQDVKSLQQVKPGDYHLLYIPGGKAPAELRKDSEILLFVKQFADSGRLVAAICHGPQVLISAGIVSGKRMACWPEVRKELESAGGSFVDEALVEDGQFVTGRMPGDLHRFMYGVLDCLQNKSGRRAAA